MSVWVKAKALTSKLWLLVRLLSSATSPLKEVTGSGLMVGGIPEVAIGQQAAASRKTIWHSQLAHLGEMEAVAAHVTIASCRYTYGQKQYNPRHHRAAYVTMVEYV